MLLESDSSFTNALTLTIFARLAKFKVDKVYWKLTDKVETVAIMIVFELPPKESLNKHVNFESL